jgi:hypothetical protein
MTTSEKALRVLLANEREDDLRRLGEVLDVLGHEVAPFAVSDREAVELIAREDPDLTFVVFDGDDEHALALVSETVEYATGARARDHAGDRDRGDHRQGGRHGHRRLRRLLGAAGRPGRHRGRRPPARASSSGSPRRSSSSRRRWSAAA